MKIDSKLKTYCTFCRKEIKVGPHNPNEFICPECGRRYPESFLERWVLTGYRSDPIVFFIE